MRGSTHLDPQQVIDGGDDDVDSCVVAGLRSQVILKIYVRSKDVITGHSKV